MTIVPPPWTLTGRGFVLVYRFPRDWALRHGFIPPERASSFLGGFGAVMLVDYSSSDCGPYRELLFVPGKFRSRDGRGYYAITKIFVSTQISVNSGIANWGIPKEFAQFSWQSSDWVRGDLERVRVAQGDMPIAEFGFSSSQAFSLPVTTAILPAALRTLEQHGLDGRRLLTAPSGAGRVQPAKLEIVTVNSALFPDLSEFKPLLTVKAEPFALSFPVPSIA